MTPRRDGDLFESVKMGEAMTKEVPQITMSGDLSIQACVPKGWSDGQVLEFIESKHPCGTTNGWFIRRQGDKLLEGDDEREQCGLREDHVHVMVDA